MTISSKIFGKKPNTKNLDITSKVEEPALKFDKFKLNIIEKIEIILI